MPAISVIILTKNEGRDLPVCLESLRWCNDVHVVDSGSEDRTVELASRAGARVSCNAFESFGRQRNWALDHCHPKHDWILFLDADEKTTPEFVIAMESAISIADEEVAGFYCCWKLLLNGRWLKRSDNFPKWQFRLLRHGRARFTDFGHGQKEGQIDGRLAYLREPYLHAPFGRGWEHWEEKHRKYARQEAVARLSLELRLRDIFSPHASRRNPAIKSLVSRWALWPEIRFVYTYLLRGGFFEGAEGLEYCRRMRWFEREVASEMSALLTSKRSDSPGNV